MPARIALSQRRSGQPTLATSECPCSPRRRRRRCRRAAGSRRADRRCCWCCLLPAVQGEQLTAFHRQQARGHEPQSGMSHTACCIMSAACSLRSVCRMPGYSVRMQKRHVLDSANWCWSGTCGAAVRSARKFHRKRGRSPLTLGSGSCRWVWRLRYS